MTRDIRQIKQRWRAAVALKAWRRLTPQTRDRLLGMLEDTQREAQSNNDSEEASALAAAVNLLDTCSADGALASWDEATADVAWLTEELERLSKGR